MCAGSITVFEKIQRKLAPRPILVPLSAAPGATPVLTAKWYPPPVTTGSTYASFPALLARIKVDASGTSTCENAGFGLLTVRAQSQAITVAVMLSPPAPLPEGEGRIGLP